DGIREFHVTGVQTCALPIYSRAIEMARSRAVVSSVSAMGRLLSCVVAKEVGEDDIEVVGDVIGQSTQQHAHKDRSWSGSRSWAASWTACRVSMITAPLPPDYQQKQRLLLVGQNSSRVCCARSMPYRA